MSGLDGIPHETGQIQPAAPLHEIAAIILILCTILVVGVLMGLLLGFSIAGWP